MMKDMAKIKVSELNGLALDWAVAKSSGGLFFDMNDNWPGNYTVTIKAQSEPVIIRDLDGRLWIEHRGLTRSYSPSTKLDQCGPLIKRINRLEKLGDGWECDFSPNKPGRYGLYSVTGLTAEVAICRAVVACWWGDEVEVPAELSGGAK